MTMSELGNSGKVGHHVCQEISLGDRWDAAMTLTSCTTAAHAIAFKKTIKEPVIDKLSGHLARATS